MRQHSPHWRTLCHLIDDKLTNVYIEGAVRFEKKQKNLLTAFTYGKKIKQADLYNDNYTEQVLKEQSQRKSLNIHHHSLVNLKLK